jgi:acetylglutamate kinase
MQELVKKAEVLHEALPYIRRFRGQTFVIKYGGSAMIDEQLRQSFARDVVLMKYVGLHPVVVHGGGPQIDRTLKQMGIPSRKVNGLRVTDEKTMEVVEMVLGGRVNKEIVSLICGQGGRTLGLSGVDDGFLRAEKLPGVKTADGQLVDIGLVGHIIEVRPQVLEKLVDSDFIPVIATLAQGPDGRTLNINADTAAGCIAAAMKAEKLVLMTDREGVVDAEGRLIDSLCAEEIEGLLREGVISGGMIPKVQCALDALGAGVRKCHIIDGRIRHAVLLEIFTDRGIGTEILKKSA